MLLIKLCVNYYVFLFKFENINLPPDTLYNEDKQYSIPLQCFL